MERRLAAAALMMALAAPGWAQDALLAPAREHLLQGRPQAALDFLDPLEAALADDRDYNYLLAEALLDAGQPARALFPINRVLLRHPDDATALLMLSRARIALGQAQPAREALDRARKAPQPADVSQRIDQYLSIITAAEEAGTARFGGHVELTAGYDSNVNSATGAQQIALPVFGGAVGTLNRAATRQSDSFLGLSGSVGLRYPITADLALLAAVSAFQRFNGSHDEFDLRMLDGSAGLRYTTGENEWTGILTAQQLEVDYQRFRTATGGSLQWRRLLARRTELSAFGQLARLSYPAQSPRDADRVVGGIALAHALEGDRPLILLGSIFAGEENEHAANVPFFGHRLKGFRFGVDKSYSERLMASAAIGYEERRYGGTDPLFLVSRKDEQLDLRVAVSYTFAPRWILIPQLTHTYNRSNVELNKYRRTAFFTALRYAF